MPDLVPRLSVFLDWWRSGLLLLFPERLRRALLHEPASITITFAHDRAHALFRRDGSPAQTLDFKPDQGTAPPEFRTWVSGLTIEDLRCVALLPDHDVLRKTIDLPQAAAGNLREVVSFELDRYTPFTEDQVYFDVRVRGVDAEAGQLFVNLFVCKRDRVEGILKQMETWGLRPAVIAPSGAPESCNLLPVAPRPTGGRLLQARTQQLAWGLAGLALVALYLPPMLQVREIRALEEEIAALRGHAVQAKQLMTERDALLERTRFLIRERAAHPQVIDLLRTLTELLSDETWLSRLMIRGEELQIHGESSAATALIEKLEAAPEFSGVQFRSPVTGNPQTQKDRFQLSATVGPEASS